MDLTVINIEFMYPDTHDLVSSLMWLSHNPDVWMPQTLADALLGHDGGELE